MPTTYKVLITQSAEEDIADIWNYISEDSHENAKDFILNIETLISNLEHYPRRCPIINESEYLGISYRHLVIGKYRIIFRIDSENVYILRVIHGTRMLNL